MLNVKNWKKHTQITKTATKIIGLPTPNLLQLNHKAITRIANFIAQDTTHPATNLPLHCAALRTEVQKPEVQQSTIQ